MKNKLYVGNLPYKATQSDLQDHFSQYGEVEEVVIITDRATNRSKGFGFVTFATDEAAQKAIEATDGEEFMGRPLKVNVARPKRS